MTAVAGRQSGRRCRPRGSDISVTVRMQCPLAPCHVTSLLQVFLKNDEDIFEEALARIGEVIPDFADLEEGARRLVAAGDWSRILAHRRRLRAEPVAEEDAVYRHRVDTDRQRVRKKFFPSKALVFLKVLRE